MNTFTLQMRVRQSEGALVRVLGVTRRRRFDLLHLSANATEDGSFLDIQMTVKADRAEHTLVRQIEKLEDVHNVEILDRDKLPLGSHRASSAH
ncbi:MAG: ACT domain-containing protein [Candidatus Acidiferrales bacterium]